MDLIRGGDYSRFQGVIDWDQVPADRKIAILGMWDWKNLVVDNQLARNVAEAKRTGRVVGGYMRVNPVRWIASIEAKRMLDLLVQHGLDMPGCLWPSVDIEPTNTPADATVNWAQWTREFFAAWRSLTNLPLIVYTSGSWFKSLLGGTQDWPDWIKVWVGHTEQWGTPKGITAEQWAGKTPYELSRAVIHQYSHTGRIAGITGDVDLDCLMPGVALGSITLQDSGGNMADIWLPGYARVPLGTNVRGKPYQFTHNPKGCLHTTEGGSIAGARAAYAPYPPHLIYDWRTRTGEQHIPLNYAAYSAMDGNDDDYMIQVELVGFAAETRNWSEQALRNIAEDVIAPIEKAFGVPRVAISQGFKDTLDRISPPLASTGSPIRLTWEQLRDFSGWLGHQHLPSPDTHWDPGAIPIQKIFTYIQEGDDMSAEAERMIKVIHDFLAVSSKAPNGQTVHDAVWAVIKRVEALEEKLDKLPVSMWEEYTAANSNGDEVSMKDSVFAIADITGDTKGAVQQLSTGGVDVEALANALASPLGNHLREALGAEVYNSLVRVVNNIKVGVPGSGGQ